MDHFKSNPVYGALWVELEITFSLGVCWHIFWTCITSFLFYGHSVVAESCVILALTWNSIRVQEQQFVQYRLPYTAANNLQRIATIFVFFLSTKHALTFPEIVNRPIPFCFTNCLFAFLGVRLIWTTALLLLYVYTQTTLDPKTLWQKISDLYSTFKSSAKNKWRAFFLAITQSHRNWLMFNALDAAYCELDCVMVVGLTGAVFCNVAHPLINRFIVELSFPTFLIPYGFSLFIFAKDYHLTTVYCSTLLRLMVRISINATLLLLTVWVLYYFDVQLNHSAIATFFISRLIYLLYYTWPILLRTLSDWSRAWTSTNFSSCRSCPRLRLIFSAIILRIMFWYKNWLRKREERKRKKARELWDAKTRREQYLRNRQWTGRPLRKSDSPGTASSGGRGDDNNDSYMSWKYASDLDLSISDSSDSDIK